MRKAKTPLIMILALVTLASCRNSLLPAIDPTNPLPTDVLTVRDAVMWLFENFDYIPETDDTWLLPGETILRSGGDCEDLTILALWSVKDTFGIDGFMVVRRLSTGALHATALFDGDHFDITHGGQIYPLEETFVGVYDWADVMRIARRK